MVLSLINSQIVAAILLLVTTFLIGTMPSYIGSKIKKRKQQTLSPTTSNGNGTADNHHHPDPIEEMVPEPPKNWKSIFTFPLTLSFLMNFGAGVLFATTFVHMLPEAQESFEELWPKKSSQLPEVNSSTPGPPSDDDSPTIPRCEFIICAGFFLIFLIEEIAHGIVKHTHGFEEQPEIEDSNPPNGRKRRGSLQSNSSLKILIKNDASANYGTAIAANGDDADTADNATSSTIYIDTILDNTSSTSASDTKAKDPISLLRCLLIVIALSFHSIFDGLAIGLQGTVSHLWQLFIAISLHKSLIAFVVGLDVFSETMSFKRVVVYMLPFSIVSPIGVLVAAYAKVSVGAKTSAILSALATGSLFYITFFELMFQERASKRGVPGYVALIAILLGFILFGTISTMMPA